MVQWTRQERRQYQYFAHTVIDTLESSPLRGKADSAKVLLLLLLLLFLLLYCGYCVVGDVDIVGDVDDCVVLRDVAVVVIAAAAEIMKLFRIYALSGKKGKDSL